MFDNKSTSTQDVEKVVEVNGNVQIESLVLTHVLVSCQHDVINYGVNIQEGIGAAQQL